MGLSGSKKSSCSDGNTDQENLGKSCPPDRSVDGLASEKTDCVHISAGVAVPSRKASISVLDIEIDVSGSWLMLVVTRMVVISAGAIAESVRNVLLIASASHR